MSTKILIFCAFTFNRMKPNLKNKWTYTSLIPRIRSYLYIHTYIHVYLYIIYTQLDTNILAFCLFRSNGAFAFNGIKRNAKCKGKYIYRCPFIYTCINIRTLTHTFVCVNIHTWIHE